MSEIIVTISKEALRNKLGIVEETAILTRDRLELLEGDERLDKKAIKGIEQIEKRIDHIAQLPRGGGMTKGAADMYYLPIVGLSRTLTYNADGTLNTMTDPNGTKTMVYTAGMLTLMTGTGNYRSKTFTYSGTQLTDVIVS